MWIISYILQQCQLGIFRGVGAGLLNLSATLKAYREPAPTGLLRMVQDLSYIRLRDFLLNKKWQEVK